MSPLRTAVVGPGRIAHAHLSAIRSHSEIAELSAVVGLPEEIMRVRALAEEFGARYHSTDLAAVLADPTIDAVVLTVPNHLHSPLAIQAIEAGKHVLVEKPLANTIEEANDMIRVAERHDRVLMTAQCRRFFPGAAEARKRISELGRPLDIVHILGVYADSAQTDWWRSSAKTGGLALGLNGPHVIDTILWLMGERPVRVYAQNVRLRPSNWEGEDQATVVLSFSDGSTATGHLSLNMRAGINERWITGPHGTMQLTHDRILRFGEEIVVDGNVSSYIDGDESFNNQFWEFAAAIREHRPPQASAQEVLSVVEVLSAALESARSNRPVDL